MPDLRFRRYDAQGARAIRDTVAFIHRDAYGDAIASGDPFESPEAFMQRFDAHTRHPSLDLVVAYVGDEPAGQTWGWPMDKPTIADPSGEATEEPQSASAHHGGKPMFALAEIMVRKAWTGQGIAHALHDELLRARTEPRAELFVRPQNTRAHGAYIKWGWRKAGEIRPDLPDAPTFDVLVLTLPLAR